MAKAWLKQLLPPFKPSLWSCCCSSHQAQVRREISYPEYRFLELFFLMTRHTTIEMSDERPVTVPMAIPATVAMGNAGRLSAERREKTFNSSAFPAQQKRKPQMPLSLDSFRARGTNVIPEITACSLCGSGSRQPAGQHMNRAHTRSVLNVTVLQERAHVESKVFTSRGTQVTMRTTLSHFVSEGEKNLGYSHLAIPSEVNRKRQACFENRFGHSTSLTH